MANAIYTYLRLKIAPEQHDFLTQKVTLHVPNQI